MLITELIIKIKKQELKKNKKVLENEKNKEEVISNKKTKEKNKVRKH